MVWVRCFNVTSGAIVTDSSYNISRAGESVVILIPEKQDCTIAANNMILVDWFNLEDITLDGEKLSDLRTGNTTSRLVDFASGESYAVMSLEVTPGLHLVEHMIRNAQMAVLSYGFANHWSYGYWTNTEEGNLNLGVNKGDYKIE